MSPLKLYYFIASPPARATLCTIAALGLKVEKIEMDFMAGELMTPEYLKKNPLHTVPTLEDGDFVIFESHAINTYLVDKYGKDDSLYPKDLQKRAIVNQRLHFDNGILFPSEATVVMGWLTGAPKIVNKNQTDQLHSAYKSLELLLDGHDYAAGNDLTIADFSLAATVFNASVLVPADKKTYPIIAAWLKRMEALPYFKVNEEGVVQFRALVEKILKG